MAVKVKHDKATGEVKVTVTFVADEQTKKEGLEPGVILHHLLAVQAAPLCAAAGESALRGDDDTKVDAERAEAMAKVEAEFAKKKSVKVTVEG